MRIISGKYKGKRLIAPKKLPVRPTTDFAKEALFNILTHQINYLLHSNSFIKSVTIVFGRNVFL